MDIMKIKFVIRNIPFFPIFLISFFNLKIKGVQISSGFQFYGLPYIETARRRGKIYIGENFIATSKISKNSIGVFQPVILKSFPDAKLIIGNNVGISGSTISCNTNITIGNNVKIGSGCLITDSDAHPISPINNRVGIVNMKPIIIEDDVFIGARSIILKGIVIGKGSVIGAGSVVTKNVESYSIVAGNPARKIGQTQ